LPDGCFVTLQYSYSAPSELYGRGWRLSSGFTGGYSYSATSWLSTVPEALSELSPKLGEFRHFVLFHVPLRLQVVKAGRRWR